NERVSFASSRLYSVLDELQRSAGHVIVIGYLHPVTIRNIVQKYSNIEAILSGYAGVTGASSGWYKNAYVLFYSGDQGATVDELLDLRTNSKRGIAGVKASRMQTDLREDEETRVWLDRFFNSLEY